MSYKVVKCGDAYDIMELDTSTLIDLKYSEAKARDTRRKMNLGSGFNGWTPSFFSKKYSLTSCEETV